jgi:diadenosine tetraphosphate (Ap4A) HIT family hydrolase
VAGQAIADNRAPEAQESSDMPTIFTRIIDGELPGHFVWKDDQAVAFMTIQPIRPGHLLVIPRAEVDHWDELPEAASAHLMLVSQRIARAVKDVYSPLRVGLMIAGLEVPHTHLHVLPIDEMGDLSFMKAHAADAASLAAEAQRIRAALRARGHREADF